MNLMLLAAGEGTRLRPYTLTQPKPAMPFLNVPLAAYSLYFARTCRIDKIVVNTFHLPQKIHELFKHLPLPHQDLSFSDEVGKIMGSGGGLWLAQKHLLKKKPILLMNSDEVIIPEDHDILNKAYQTHQKADCITTLLVIDHKEVGTKFGGVWVDSDNTVIGFGKERPPQAVKGWHFVGVQILSPEILQFLPANAESNVLYDGVMSALKAGHKAQIFPIQANWYETGNPTDFLHATSECLQILAGQKGSKNSQAYLENLISEYAPQSELSIAPGSVGLVGAQAKYNPERCRGYFVLGNNSQLSQDCLIENAIVGPHCHSALSEVKNTILL